MSATETAVTMDECTQALLACKPLIEASVLDAESRQQQYGIENAYPAEVLATVNGILDRTL